MALGDFRFSLPTAAYQSLQRSAAYSWAGQTRVGREPAQQYTGPGERAVTLSGVIYPHFRGGLQQVEQMRTLAGRGQPLPLTDGTGKYWGKWVITKIDEEQTHFIGPGLPQKITFSLALKAYGEDR